MIGGEWGAHVGVGRFQHFTSVLQLGLERPDGFLLDLVSTMRAGNSRCGIPSSANIELDGEDYYCQSSGVTATSPWTHS